MKKICTLLSFVFLLGNVIAQNCPPISVTGPISVKAGEGMSFSVNVSGTSVTYNWMVSAGTIESGQGTPVVKVNTTGMGGQSVTATVELGGLPATCTSMGSATSSVDAVPETELHLSGNYSTSKMFKADAELFAGDIMSGNYILETPQAIIFLYPGKNATAATAVKEMTVVLKAAFVKKGLKAPMYTIKTVGKRAQTSYEMWIVPQGGKYPEATPLQ